MKNSIIMLVIGSVLFACAATTEQEEETEGAAVVEQAVSYIGYCQTDSARKLTGTCVGGSGLCLKKLNHASCPVGATALQYAQMASVCGTVRFDNGRRCTF